MRHLHYIYALFCYDLLQTQHLTWIEISLLIFFLALCVYDIQAKVEEARDALMEVTKSNTERLLSMKNLLDQKRELEHKLNARQKKMVISVH